MIVNSYLTDEITIVNISSDKWGVITSVDDTGIKARIEDVNILLKDKEGKEVVSNTLVILGPTETIKYEDKVKITKKNGSAYPLATKEMAIMKLELCGGFSKSHYEVYL